ncbi:MAG: hypothetical protein Q6359_10695 [Candidatus Brocadiales bacterium]|nr:hypothetical protein [Candidatus Brocadiales bacterium]
MRVLVAATFRLRILLTQAEVRRGESASGTTCGYYHSPLALNRTRFRAGPKPERFRAGKIRQKGV